MEKNSISRVREIKLKVGEFTGIEPSCLDFYFGVLSKDTIVEGATLKIEIVALRGKCQTCKKVFELNDEPLDFSMGCPFCFSAEVEIISGRELFIEEIEGD